MVQAISSWWRRAAQLPAEGIFSIYGIFALIATAMLLCGLLYMVYLCVRLVFKPRLEVARGVYYEKPLENSTRTPRGILYKRLALIFILFLGTRLLLLVLFWLANYFQLGMREDFIGNAFRAVFPYGYSAPRMGFFEYVHEKWIRWDGFNYIRLAKHWYLRPEQFAGRTEPYIADGQMKYYIAFFPLYPITIRIMKYFTDRWLLSVIAALCASVAAYFSMRGVKAGNGGLGHTRMRYNASAAFAITAALLWLFAALSIFKPGEEFCAFIIANIAGAGGACLLYMLVLRDHGHETAMAAVLFMGAFPFSFFFTAPFGEGTFILFTLAAALCARDRKYIIAGIFGALSAYNRINGIIICGLIWLEAWLHAAQLTREMHGTESIGRRAYFALRKERKHAIIRGIAGGGIVFLGFIAYLFLNWQVSGNPFQFSIYQTHHWNNEFGSIFKTVQVQLYQLINGVNGGWKLGVWLPTLILIFSSLALLLAAARKLRLPHYAYACVYLFYATSPTWLISGPRYFAGFFMLPYILAVLIKSKRARNITLCILAVFLLYYTGIYSICGTVL